MYTSVSITIIGVMSIIVGMLGWKCYHRKTTPTIIQHAIEREPIPKPPPKMCIPKFKNSETIKKYITRVNPKLYPLILDDIVINIVEIKSTNRMLLVMGIMQVESTFNPLATSKSNAIGLMQISPIHKTDLIQANIIKSSIYELYEPSVNIKAANWLLDRFDKKYNGDIDKILVAYLGANNKTYINNVKSNIANIMFTIED